MTYVQHTNSPPVAAILEIQPQLPDTLDDLEVNYTFIDANLNGEAGTRISWYKFGSHQPAFENLTTIPNVWTNKSDIWHVRVVPSDGIEFGNPVQSDPVTIGNTAPLALNVTVCPVDPLTNVSLLVNYTYFDYDGDPESGTIIKWFNNSVHLPQFDGLMILSHVYTNKSDHWYAEVTPSDGDGLGPANRSNTIYVQNAAPSIDTVVLGPPGADSSTNLTLTYAFQDADDDEESISLIRWFQNGIHVPALDNRTTIPANFTSKGDEWNAVVVPFDGMDFGLPVPSNSLNITNTRPSASNVQLDFNETVTTTDVTLAYTYFDDDNDDEKASNIFWYKDGVHVPSLDNTMVLPASFTNKSDKWHAEVEPYDGFDYGEALASQNVTIVNSPPVVSNLSVTPQPCYSIDDLCLDYDFNDADGDVESGTTITWFRNNILQVVHANATIIPASETSEEDVWRVDVVASDGTETGSLASITSISILVNDAPRINNVTDIQMDEGDAGWAITWIIIDAVNRNGKYDVLINGRVAIANHSWDNGEMIVIQLISMQPGTYNFTIRVDDGLGGAVEKAVMVSVSDVPDNTQPDWVLPASIAIICTAGATIAAAGVVKSKKHRIARRHPARHDKTDPSPSLVSQASEARAAAPAEAEHEAAQDVKAPAEAEHEAAQEVKAPAAQESVTVPKPAATTSVITEDDMVVLKEKHYCLVHKGPVEGYSFICPGCGAYYCVKCIEAIKTIENKCWSCRAQLDPLLASTPQPQAEQAKNGPAEGNALADDHKKHKD